MEFEFNLKVTEDEYIWIRAAIKNVIFYGYDMENYNIKILEDILDKIEKQWKEQSEMLGEMIAEETRKKIEEIRNRKCQTQEK